MENAKQGRRKSICVGESIYLGMEIAKIMDDVTYDGNIATGTNWLTGIKFGSVGYQGGVRDISILPVWAKQVGEPLPAEENTH